MKARILMLVAAAMAVAVFAVNAEDKEEKDPLKGIKCVVSGKAAKDVDGSSVAYKGGKVFFCCAGCPKAFDKDTQKFAAKANHQLIATGQAKQAKCPITGKDLNPEQKVKVQDVEVTFCCPGCKGKVSKAEGAEQAELVFSDKAFDKGFKIAKKGDKKEE